MTKSTECLVTLEGINSIQETAIRRWIKEVVDDGRLKEMDIDFANSQLHSLIKGSGFWPQLMQMKPMLSSEEMAHIADQSAAMFLSHYELSTQSI